MDVLKLCVVVVFLVIGMVGCAGPGVGSKAVSQQDEAQNTVAGLVASRWDALINGDLDKAYKYLSPGARSAMPLDAYKNSIRPGAWKKASVDSVLCKEQDLCKVVVVIELRYRAIKSIESRVNETWLQESGKWWYVPRQ